MIVIQALNINEAFYKLIRDFTEKDTLGNYVNAYEVGIDAGSYGKDKGGDQFRLQADLVTIEISHPEVRPLAVEFPEGMGIPPVTSEEKINDYFVDYIINPDIPANEDYTYGSRMTNWDYITSDNEIVEYANSCSAKQWVHTTRSLDQVQWVIDHFKEFPQNNHCCIQIAKGEDLLLKSAPCLRSVSWKIARYRVYDNKLENSWYEKRLNMTVFFRSWDIWTGLPSNLGGLQLLNEYVASEIGVPSGKLFAVSDGAHAYEMYLDLINQRLGR
jgi:thymidylate synthase